LWLLAIIVGVARVIAGVHHTIDIIGSLIIATIIPAIIFHFILPKIFSAWNKNKKTF
jgi:membrane-associated phospholipid phosphatase